MDVGVVEHTYHLWRKKYSGMGSDQLKELDCGSWSKDGLHRTGQPLGAQILREL